MNRILVIFIALFFMFGCSPEEEEASLDITKLGGEYLGESFPYGEAKLFLDGLIKDRYHLQNLVFSPDGEEFYFTRTTLDNDSMVIFYSRLVNENWTNPRPLSFIDGHNYTDPFVSPDNQKLFFSSDRPIKGADEQNYDFNIWFSERNNGIWGEPFFLEEVNSIDDEFSTTLTVAGELYFASSRSSAEGYWDLYKSKLVDGKFTQPERLPEPINSNARDFDPSISKDGNKLFFSSDRNDGFGSGDIYYSKLIDDTWSEPINLGGKINTNDHEYCPRISYDGSFLFFTRSNPSEKYFYQEKALDTRDPFEHAYIPEAGLSSVYWITIDSLSNVNR